MQQPLPYGFVQGGVGGGVAGLLLRSLAETTGSPSTPLIPCEPCLDSAVAEGPLDYRSFLIGLGVGCLIWPFLDFILIFRAYLHARLRQRLEQVFPLHRLL